jgi:hypothetical protein
MQQTNNQLYGRYLGYPDCCIEAFGDVAIPFILRPEISRQASFEGFLPCPSCAKKLLAGDITYNELINPNRKCSVPFGLHNHEQKLQISKELDALTID